MRLYQKQYVDQLEGQMAQDFCKVGGAALIQQQEETETEQK